MVHLLVHMAIYNLILIAEDEEAFDVLYCVAFQMMDAQWLAMRASYLQFNVCMRALLFCIIA